MPLIHKAPTGERVSSVPLGSLLEGETSNVPAALAPPWSARGSCNPCSACGSRSTAAPAAGARRSDTSSSAPRCPPGGKATTLRICIPCAPAPGNARTFPQSRRCEQTARATARDGRQPRGPAEYQVVRGWEI
eukprot:1184206-Pyramimonas_sp.AAC.1